MADSSGLIGGIGKGLENFVNTYQQQKQINRQDQIAQAGLLEKGYNTDPDTGDIYRTDQGKQADQLATLKFNNEKEDYDPNSAKSQAAVTAHRALFNQFSPGAGDKLVPDGLSVKDLNDKFSDTMVKPYIAGQTAIQDTNTKAAAARDAAAQRAEAIRDAANSRRQDLQDRNSDRQDKQADDKFKTFQESLDPNKGRAGNAAQLQTKLNQADRLNQLVAAAKNGQGLDSRQTEELAIGLQSMLSNGGGSTNEVQALVPHTWMGRSQSFKEYIMNNPQALNNQAFVDRMADTINRERGVTEGQLKSALYARVAPYSSLEKKDPDRFKEILQSQPLLDYDEYKNSWLPGQMNKGKAKKGLLGDSSQSAAPQGGGAQGGGAPAPNGHASVIQNGVTYNWNAATGKYE